LFAAYGTSLRVEPENRDAVHFVSNLLVRVVYTVVDGRRLVDGIMPVQAD